MSNNFGPQQQPSYGGGQSLFSQQPPHMQSPQGMLSQFGMGSNAAPYGGFPNMGGYGPPRSPGYSGMNSGMYSAWGGGNPSSTPAPTAEWQGNPTDGYPPGAGGGGKAMPTLGPRGNYGGDGSGGGIVNMPGGVQSEQQSPMMGRGGMSPQWNPMQSQPRPMQQQPMGYGGFQPPMRGNGGGWSPQGGGGLLGRGGYAPQQQGRRTLGVLTPESAPPIVADNMQQGAQADSNAPASAVNAAPAMPPGFVDNGNQAAPQALIDQWHQLNSNPATQADAWNMLQNSPSLRGMRTRLPGYQGDTWFNDWSNGNRDASGRVYSPQSSSQSPDWYGRGTGIVRGS